MSKVIIAIATCLLLIAGGGYYYFLYPPVIMKRETQDTLNSFSVAVNSKDRVRVAASLNILLADSAKVRLEVSFFSMAGASSVNGMAQDFDKASFLTFIDNILYSLRDYSYTPRITHFALNPDKKTAIVEFTSEERGEGTAYYEGMGVDTRFNSDTRCRSEVTFEQNQAQLREVACKMQLRSSPKTSHENQPRNP